MSMPSMSSGFAIARRAACPIVRSLRDGSPVYCEANTVSRIKLGAGIDPSAICLLKCNLIKIIQFDFCSEMPSGFRSIRLID